MFIRIFCLLDQNETPSFFVSRYGFNPATYISGILMRSVSENISGALFVYIRDWPNLINLSCKEEQTGSCFTVI
jgi:hypothetical protein